MVCIVKTYSTLEVAQAIGVDKSTLLRWLYSGKLAEPTRKMVEEVSVRVWSEKDLQRARKHREERYRRRS
jgi:predicted site-specific integrase-resolvase